MATPDYIGLHPPAKGRGLGTSIPARMFPRVRLNAGLRYVSYSKNNARTAVPFEDTATAYQAKKTSELFRHVIVFSVFTYEGVIQRSQKVRRVRNYHGSFRIRNKGGMA